MVALKAIQAEYQPKMVIMRDVGRMAMGTWACVRVERGNVRDET